jgi:hypothetical protein
VSVKVYQFECRNHPEVPGTDQTKETLSFEVRYEGEAKEPRLIHCPLCGGECGVLGVWRHVEENALAEEWRSKWNVAIGIWEKVASELGNTKRKLSETATELLNMKTGLLTTPESKKDGGLN